MRLLARLLPLLIFVFAELAFAQEVRLRPAAKTRSAKAAPARTYREVPAHHTRVYAAPNRLGRRQAERIQVPDGDGGYLQEDLVTAGAPRAAARKSARRSFADGNARRNRKALAAARTTPATKSSARLAARPPAPGARKAPRRRATPPPPPRDHFAFAEPSMSIAPATPAETPARLHTRATDLVDLRAPRELFHAHGTESARTLRPGQFSYSRVAGTDSIEGTFLLNSVNVGVMDGVQLGANPFLYALQDSFNFSAKIGFYDSDHWAFALGYSHLTFNLPSMSGLRFHQNGLSVITNYFLDDRWSFSYLAQATHSYGAMESIGYDYERISDVSHFADAQFRFAPHWYTTAGLSWSPGKPAADRVLSDPMTVGLGASVTWKYPKSWFFAYPSAGLHYYPSYATQTFLISAYFHP